MAMAERADLVTRMSLDDKFSGPLKRIESNTRKSASIMRGAISTGLGVGLERAAERGARALIGLVRGGLADLATLESAITSVDGAIKQVGLTGKVTGAQIAGWANEIEASVGAAFDDKDITQAATTLIRFGKVTSANIRPALVVMTDLATKTGSVESAASLLAKALADPTKAAGKLARSGVILTKAQQAEITALVKAGKVGKAQALILNALSKATQGAALASQGPYARSLSVLKDVTEDAQKALATGFLPVIERVRDILSRELAKPETLDRIKEFGQGIAGGLDSLVTAAQGVDWGAIGSGLKTAGQGAKAIFDAFMGLPPDVKGILIGLTALNKLSGGGVIRIGVDILTGAGGLLFQQFLGRGSIANPMVVIPVGGGLGGPGGVAPVGGGGAAKFLGGVVVSALVLTEALSWVQDNINMPKLQEQAGKNISATEAVIATGSTAQMRSALSGLESSVASLSGLQKVLYDLNANGVKVHTEGLEAALKAALSEQSRTNLQPLPENISKKQEKNFNTLRDKIEGSRIATVRRLTEAKAAVDLVRTSAQADRVALVASQRTGDADIVAAIRGIQRPIVSVSVVGNRVTTTYATGTTLSRNINPNVLALT